MVTYGSHHNIDSDNGVETANSSMSFIPNFVKLGSWVLSNVIMFLSGLCKPAKWLKGSKEGSGKERGHDNIKTPLQDALLTNWALLEKPPIVKLLKNLLAFYGTRRFITVVTRALSL
jgi:hypothetical protein